MDSQRDCESRLVTNELYVQKLRLVFSYTDEGNFGENASLLKDL